ncbi:MAG: GTP-binding protein [Candidatus Lokiarchaeota archaeon]|nr:GTP-binding protein [Candidatus Lokiarchaeota archaeon]
MNELIRRFRFKITVIGDGGVGKTSLIQKFTNDTFTKDYIKTIGAQFSVFDKEIKTDKVKLLFWDIAGQDDFNFLRPAFFKDSRAAIVVYSLEYNELGDDSFEHISNWVKDIYSYCGEIPVIIFANKVDLVDEQKLDISKISELVKNNDFLGYFITSAKTGQGVIEAFNTIIDNLYLQYKDAPF